MRVVVSSPARSQPDRDGTYECRTPRCPRPHYSRFRRDRIERHAAHVFVDHERLAHRREGALAAVGALARAARDADGHANVGVLEIDAVRINEALRVLEPAAEADRHHGLLRMVAAAVFLNRAREAAVRLAL